MFQQCFHRGFAMTPMSRRASRRSLLTAAGAAALGLAAAPAGAYRGWCRTDPLVLIDGTTLADIFVAVDNPVEMVFESTGPVEYTIALPKGVSGKLLAKGVGFGHGERVEFASSRRLKRTKAGIAVRIAVRVPCRGDYPLAVEFAPQVVGLLNPDRVLGRTNERVILATRC